MLGRFARVPVVAAVVRHAAVRTPVCVRPLVTVASSTPSDAPFMSFMPLKPDVCWMDKHALSVLTHKPFLAPPPSSPAKSQSLSQTPTETPTETLQLTSVLRKRRLKMNKHKHKKLRKRTRALRKRLGK
ncbi:hypothetical protein BDF14DRAFT_1878405 [Spinellus fusiger]|nr:hypothetical protein BDF14DRAFT_1878405 [Spinellus fusiger]